MVTTRLGKYAMHALTQQKEDNESLLLELCNASSEQPIRPTFPGTAADLRA